MSVCVCVCVCECVCDSFHVVYSNFGRVYVGNMGLVKAQAVSSASFIQSTCHTHARTHTHINKRNMIHMLCSCYNKFYVAYSFRQPPPDKHTKFVVAAVVVVIVVLAA